MADGTTLLEVAQQFSHGETVFIAGSSGEPLELTQLLDRDSSLAPKTNFVTSFVPGINRCNLAPVGSDRRMQVFFMQPSYEEAVRAGTVSFAPLAYSGIVSHLADPTTALDTIIVQVAAPGSDGLYSLGAAVEFMPTLLQRSARVIGIVNSNAPDIPGAFRLSRDRFNLLATSSAPLAEYDVGAPTREAQQIADYIASVIPNGATLQLGLGKVPSLLLLGLRGRRGLAFHSGMLSDSILPLAEAGMLSASIVTTVGVGTRDFYGRLATVGGLRIAGVEFTHDFRVLSSIERLVAVNSALEVDLKGQVNAEMLGGRYVSGPGGLPDFAHAARRSPGGMSIIALNSASGSGAVSRIVAAIEGGDTVTVPQSDVDMVVTEWGVADLRDCSTGERAHRLVAIAHPRHREQLLAKLAG